MHPGHFRLRHVLVPLAASVLASGTMSATAGATTRATTRATTSALAGVTDAAVTTAASLAWHAVAVQAPGRWRSLRHPFDWEHHMPVHIRLHRRRRPGGPRRVPRDLPGRDLALGRQALGVPGDRDIWGRGACRYGLREPDGVLGHGRPVRRQRARHDRGRDGTL
jgi:hypothetical protein